MRSPIVTALMTSLVVTTLGIGAITAMGLASWLAPFQPGMMMFIVLVAAILLSIVVAEPSDAPRRSSGHSWRVLVAASAAAIAFAGQIAALTWARADVRLAGLDYLASAGHVEPLQGALDDPSTLVVGHACRHSIGALPLERREQLVVRLLDEAPSALHTCLEPMAPEKREPLADQIVADLRASLDEEPSARSSDTQTSKTNDEAIVARLVRFAPWSSQGFDVLAHCALGAPRATSRTACAEQLASEYTPAEFAEQLVARDASGSIYIEPIREPLFIASTMPARLTDDVRSSSRVMGLQKPAVRRAATALACRDLATRTVPVELSRTMAAVAARAGCGGAEISNARSSEDVDMWRDVCAAIDDELGEADADPAELMCTEATAQITDRSFSMARSIVSSALDARRRLALFEKISVAAADSDLNDSQIARIRDALARDQAQIVDGRAMNVEEYFQTHGLGDVIAAERQSGDRGRQRDSIDIDAGLLERMKEARAQEGVSERLGATAPPGAKSGLDAKQQERAAESLGRMRQMMERGRRSRRDR